jgi:hypothetical protein
MVHMSCAPFTTCIPMIKSLPTNRHSGVEHVPV